MRLVMTLLVRDEQDIVAANLDFHLSQGVDFVVATDNGSIDATTEILRSYERRGVLRLLHEPDDDFAQGRWVTRMARLAADEHGADWVINNDADEFWLATDESLKQTLSEVPADVPALTVPRSNFPPVASSGGPFWREMTVRERNSVNFRGRPLPGKVCHRAHPEITVSQGNHAVSAGPQKLHVKAVTSQSMSILHFPLRTYEQFAAKIANGGAAYGRNTDLPTEVGSGWRSLYDLLLAGGLPHHFAAQTLSSAYEDAGLASGTLVRDVRLRDHLEALYG